MVCGFRDSTGARTFLSAATPERSTALKILRTLLSVSRCCGQECPRADSTDGWPFVGPLGFPGSPSHFLNSMMMPLVCFNEKELIWLSIEARFARPEGY